MSVKDIVIGYEIIGCKLNEFLYEGRVKDNIRVNHTKEELEEMLEDIRLDCWNSYQEATEDLGWK